MRGFFMGNFKIHMVGRKRVEILQRFDNSVLVRYVKTGIESCIQASLIKSKDPSLFKSNKKKPKWTGNKKGPNNQLNLDL